MTSPFIIIGLLLCTSTEQEVKKKAAEVITITGKVRLTKAVGEPLVSLINIDGKFRLKGESVSEIKRLQSAQIEIVGVREGHYLVVKQYKIVDIGRGVRPLIGMLIKTDRGLGLKDGSGTPIPLNLSPRLQTKLHAQVGAKIWIHGDNLVSGELKVLRYGILRPAVILKTPENKETETSLNPDTET